MQAVLRNAIEIALNKLDIAQCDFSVEHPANREHGEYATNVALITGKQLGLNPRDVATKLVHELTGNIPGISRLDIAGPGFINFYCERAFFTEGVVRAREEGEMWGTNKMYAGKKVMVEYTDPNPFKELHIGHLVPNALGESLACLMEMSGAHVKRVTFQGDVGMHVAKGIYSMLKDGVESAQITPELLGKAYAEGSAAFEKSESIATEIKELNKKIYERSDERVNALYDAGKKVSLEYFEKAYSVLGSAFDHYFFESVTGPIGKALVTEHVGTVFSVSQGAIIYEGEKRGLHTRVFINTQGLPTYEAKDLGLVKAKHDWWPFDLSITVTGTEQQHYFTVVAKAVGEVLPELAGHVELVPNGMLRLSEGKMSSRTGNVIRALDLIDEVVSRVKEVMGDRTLTNADITAQQIAVGAIKYVILRNSAGKDIVFDMKSSVSLDGDSGPYLQYAYARACSVIKKAHDAGIVSHITHASPEPYTIEHHLYQFPEVIERAVTEREPHHVVTYLTELASEWNAFYATERIADPDDEYASYKVAVAEAVATTLSNGLRALGIVAPPTM